MFQEQVDRTLTKDSKEIELRTLVWWNMIKVVIRKPTKARENELCNGIWFRRKFSGWQLVQKLTSPNCKKLLKLAISRRNYVIQTKWDHSLSLFLARLSFQSGHNSPEKWFSREFTLPAKSLFITKEHVMAEASDVEPLWAGQQGIPSLSGPTKWSESTCDGTSIRHFWGIRSWN